VAREDGDPFVVANGAEGEPGSIKDRYVMTARAADVLQGLALAARAVSAKEAVVYLKGSFAAAAAALERARAAAQFDGLPIEIRRGEESYVVGEETALLESLEGRRAWPRPKPPYPAAVGYRGRPTLVQNVETLSRVPSAVADPEAFRAAAQTLVSLWGHVARPGVYEVRLGTPLARVIEDQGGGAQDGVSLVFPAGPSAPPLAPERLDTPLDADALAAAGSALGTASVLVVGAGKDIASVMDSLSAFFERESCRQCPPCTVGTATLRRIASAAAAGTARAKDYDGFGEAAAFMKDHGYCAHCRTAATSVGALLARCGGSRPAGSACRPFDADSPERRAIEAVAAGF
jgi:NADH:ubiquinone oxidoreductase subunit F (NADH-binding)